MGSDHSPSAGRFTRWAIGLTLPLVLSAAAMPWILEKLRAGRTMATAGAPEPPRPEIPSTSEVAAATRTIIDAAQVGERNLAGATFYAPREARTTAEGERVSPFPGFGLSIGSTPSGASVRVDGREVGGTPIVTNLDCDPGQVVEVRVEKAGFRSIRREVRCRADELVEMRFTLRR